MKAYIQSQNNTIDVPAFSVAAAGFKSLGIPVNLFEKDTLPPTEHKEDIIVGSSYITRKHLSRFGLSLPSIDYPEELHTYFNRPIKCSTLGALTDSDVFPIFVKPLEEKLFCGTVINSKRDLTILSNFSESTPIYTSTIIKFISEWRFFVHYGKIIGFCPYIGHPKDICDISLVKNAVSTYKSAPCGYALDFGLTEDGNTVLIEANDGYSLCNYILPSIPYTKLLISRWCEIMEIPDSLMTKSQN